MRADQIDSHLRTYHSSTRGMNLKIIISSILKYFDGRGALDLRNINGPIPAIPLIPVISAYRCRSCCYSTTSLKSYGNHFKEQHGSEIIDADLDKKPHQKSLFYSSSSALFPVIFDVNNDDSSITVEDRGDLIESDDLVFSQISNPVVNGSKSNVHASENPLNINFEMNECFPVVDYSPKMISRFQGQSKCYSKDVGPILKDITESMKKKYGSCTPVLSYLGNKVTNELFTFRTSDETQKRAYMRLAGFISACSCCGEDEDSLNWLMLDDEQLMFAEKILNQIDAEDDTVLKARIGDFLESIFLADDGLVPNYEIPIIRYVLLMNIKEGRVWGNIKDISSMMSDFTYMTKIFALYQAQKFEQGSKREKMKSKIEEYLDLEGIFGYLTQALGILNKLGKDDNF